VRSPLKEIAFGLAVSASALLLVMRIYSGFVERPGHPTFAELAMPMLITLQPVIFRTRAIQVVAACLIVVFMLITGFRIGVFFLPATIVALLATFSEPVTKNV
jgi:hypothetical protein